VEVTTLRSSLCHLRDQREKAIRALRRKILRNARDSERMRREIRKLEKELFQVSNYARACAFGAPPATEDGAAVSLSPREAEVLTLVSEGLLNKQIGAALHISERTSKFHVSNLLAKYGVDRRGKLPRLRAVS
jgi:DNA-binding NarL/FixJ family response regulator